MTGYKNRFTEHRQIRGLRYKPRIRSIQRKKFEKNTPETDDIQNNYIDLPPFS